MWNLKTTLSTGNEREFELKYLKILFHIEQKNSKKPKKGAMMYHFDPMTRTVRATMIWDGVHPMDLAVSIMILTLQSSIRIWIRIFWSGRDKLDSLFVTCISSFMFAFDSFLTWPMVPLKQKPENGNYFTLAMWRSWKPLDLIQTQGYRVQLYMILCRANFALSYKSGTILTY